jgi:hypothetical protein
MSALRVAKRPRPKVQGSFEVIEREADPSVMNWAINRYSEWLIRLYLGRDSQPAEKNDRL